MLYCAPSWHQAHKSHPCAGKSSKIDAREASRNASRNAFAVVLVPVRCRILDPRCARCASKCVGPAMAQFVQGWCSRQLLGGQGTVPVHLQMDMMDVTLVQVAKTC